MKISTFFILLVFLSPFDAISQNDEIYATNVGMKKNLAYQENVVIHVKNQGEGYLIVDWFEDSTGTKFTDLYKIWGIKYNNEYYFHLSNARGLNALKSFIKIDSASLHNNYLPFSINCEAPINKPTTPTQVGVAAGGVAIGMLLGSDAGLIFMISIKDTKSAEYWYKQNGDGAFLYVVDMKSSLAPIGKRLTKKRLKKLMAKKGGQKDVDYDSLKLEDAMSLINQLK